MQSVLGKILLKREKYQKQHENSGFLYHFRLTILCIFAFIHLFLIQTPKGRLAKANCLKFDLIMDDFLKELEEDLPPIPKEVWAPLSPYYYKRLHEGTLWRQSWAPPIDPDTLVEQILDYSPMEKGLILVSFVGVWVGVMWAETKISRQIGKLVK